MDLEEQFKKAKILKTTALDYEDISQAILIHPRDVVLDERVRFQCSYSGCRDYGLRYMCPPFTPDIGEFKKVLSKYFMSLLVQLEGKISDLENWEPEADKYSIRLHNIVYELEKKAFSLGFPFAAGLIGGSCKLCQKCPAKEDPQGRCLQREKARPSLEGLGIDVLKTCENAGINITFSSNKVAFTGLILIN